MPKRILHLYFHGLGDSLLFNTVLDAVGRVHGEPTWLATKYPEMYLGNPWVRTMPFTDQRIAHQVARFMTAAGFFEKMEYVDYYHRGSPPPAHLLALLAERVGLADAPTRPLLHLSAAEVARAALPDTLLGKPWIAVQAPTGRTWNDNKNWFADRLQQAVEALRSEFSFVQLGASGDVPLKVDLNMAGRVGPRQATATLSHCAMFLGQEGYLMHAAAAVNTRSVIIYGGFTRPDQTGYAWNENLYRAVPCAPCWLLSPCPHAKKCMDLISVEDVISAVRKIMAEDKPTGEL
jgi:ADP-heptose:LPS heptosyltransferase